MFFWLRPDRDKNAVLKAMATDTGVVQYDVMGIMIIILTIDRDFHGILEPRL